MNNTNKSGNALVETACFLLLTICISGNHRVALYNCRVALHYRKDAF